MPLHSRKGHTGGNDRNDIGADHGLAPSQSIINRARKNSADSVAHRKNTDKSNRREIMSLCHHLCSEQYIKAFIAEGFHHTKDINKYTLRLFIFAIISHFAYAFGSYQFEGVLSFIPFATGKFLNQTSVMWSLAWGLVMLRIDYSQRIKSNFVKALLIILICVVTLPSDWSSIASLIILAFGTNRGNFKKQVLYMMLFSLIYAIVYFFALDKIYGIIQLGVVLSIPLLMLYNGQRGNNQKVNNFLKWFFYIYYPLHLVILGLIQLLIK